MGVSCHSLEWRVWSVVKTTRRWLKNWAITPPNYLALTTSLSLSRFSTHHLSVLISETDFPPFCRSGVWNISMRHNACFWFAGNCCKTSFTLLSVFYIHQDDNLKETSCHVDRVENMIFCYHILHQLPMFVSLPPSSRNSVIIYPWEMLMRKWSFHMCSIIINLHLPVLEKPTLTAVLGQWRLEETFGLFSSKVRSLNLKAQREHMWKIQVSSLGIETRDPSN